MVVRLSFMCTSFACEQGAWEANHTSAHATLRVMHRSLTYLTVVIVFLVVTLLAFSAADLVSERADLQALVQQFGFGGIVFLALVGGLNLFVPVPAATFTPVFMEAGFSMLLIITGLVIGTTIADTVGYLIGRLGGRRTRYTYPHIHERLVRFSERWHVFLIPGVFLYAAIVPFPNEAILLPLGLMGFRFIVLVVPLILGTLVNQTALAFGFSNVFTFLF